MATFLEAVGNGVRALTCGVLSDAERSVEWVADRVGTPQVGAETVKQLRRWVCNNPDDDVTLNGPPFLGGQCDCNRYTVQVYVRRQPSGELAFAGNWRVRGPISSVYVASNGQLRGVSRSGWAITSQPYPSCSTLEDRRIGAGLWGGASTVESVTIVEAPDGDDCGSLPGEPVPPYIPVTINRDITYVDIDNIEVTEEGDFTLLAPVFIGGAIIAPVRVDVGGVEFPLNFNLETGEITFDFSRDFIESPTPISEPTPAPNPTPDEPDVESDDLLYGLIVYSAPSGVSPVTTLVGQSGAPALRLPRTGNVYFQVPIGDRVTWEGPVPVQMENQLIMVPSGLGATGYRVVPNTGWELSAVRVGKPG